MVVPVVDYKGFARIVGFMRRRRGNGSRRATGNPTY